MEYRFTMTRRLITVAVFLLALLLLLFFLLGIHLGREWADANQKNHAAAPALPAGMAPAASAFTQPADDASAQWQARAPLSESSRPPERQGQP